MRKWPVVALVVISVAAAFYVGFLLVTARFVIGAAALTHPVGDYWVPEAQTVYCFKDISGTDDMQVVAATGADVKDVDVQLVRETPVAIDLVATGSKNVFAGDVIAVTRYDERNIHLSEPRGNRPVTSDGESIDVCTGF